MMLGIMGGTFDPIHLGHLRAAETAREALGLARVLFIPAGQPPHRAAPSASALDRWAMVCLATAPHVLFEATDVEIGRTGPSYTVDTLDSLRHRQPADELVLIVGSDTVSEMPSWKTLERLLSLCRVAVVARPGDRAAGETVALPTWAERVSGPGLNVSATLIRQLVAQGRSVRHLLPDGVADHIAKRGLYR
jgi:nicotinate-nucleotide adenylyltransferase